MRDSFVVLNRHLLQAQERYASLRDRQISNHRQDKFHHCSDKINIDNFSFRALTIT